MARILSETRGCFKSRGAIDNMGDLIRESAGVDRGCVRPVTYFVWSGWTVSFLSLAWRCRWFSILAGKWLPELLWTDFWLLDIAPASCQISIGDVVVSGTRRTESGDLRHWRHCIFSDESRFLLCHSDGKGRVCLRQGRCLHSANSWNSRPISYGLWYNRSWREEQPVAPFTNMV